MRAKSSSAVRASTLPGGAALPSYCCYLLQLSGTALICSNQSRTRKDDMPSLGAWINEEPRPLMAPAAMAAFVTYRAAIKPPLGFWSQDKAGPGGHAAGTPVMATLFPASYAWFRLLNATAFYASLLLMLLCSSQRFYSTPARMAAVHLIALLDLLCVVAVYVFASSPEDPLRGFANLLLPGVGIWVLVYSGVVIGDWIVCLYKGNTEDPVR